MSIKGFSVGGNVERYDYNALDNIPSEITIDIALSGSSTNPVQNKVVTGAINATTDSVTSLSGEVSDLKSDIDWFHRWGGKNILDTSDLVLGYSINSSGTMTANTDVQSTRNFSPIEGGASYVVSNNGVSAPMLIVAFYSSADESTFISRVTNVTSFTAPATANFIRVSDNHYYSGTWSVAQILKSQIEKGNTITAFEPFSVIPYSVVSDVSESRLDAHELAQYKFEDLTGVTSADGYYSAVTGKWSANPVLVSKTVTHTTGTSYRYIGHVYGSASYYGVAYLDENDVVIDGEFVSNSTERWVDEIVTPPDGTAKVVFTTSKNNAANNADSYMYVQKAVTVSVADKYELGNMGFNDIPSLDTCFMHIPIYGQSLSVGADAPYYNDGTVDGLYMLADIKYLDINGGLVPLQLTHGFMNPIVSALHDLKKLADSNGATHHIITSSSGRGGRSLAQLASSDIQAEIKSERGLDYNIDVDSPLQYSKWEDNCNKILQIGNRLGFDVECPVIVFLQGERDFYTDAQLNSAGADKPNAYACGDDKALYKSCMGKLKNAMQAYVMSLYGQSYKPLFAIYPCSGDFIRTTKMGVTMAQQEFARENDDVILLATQYPMPNYNNGHCTTNGYRWLGEYIGKELTEALIYRNKPKQLEGLGGYVVGNKAFIETDGGYLPLVVDTYTVQSKTNYGFKLYVDGSEATVTSVTLQGNTIVLTSSTNMDSATKVEVTYAQDVFNGHGNIRDSLPYRGQFAYLDDSSDTGSGGNLSIVYRPLDKDGNSLVGQRYPMQNWLVPFYLKIVG